MVGEDAHRVLCTEEQGTTTFEAENDAGQFSIVDVVVPFCREETARVEGDGMHTIVMFLRDDHPKSIPRCIGMHDKWLGPVGRLEDQFTGTDLFEALEGCLAAFRPVPLAVFARQVIQWSGNVGEIGNESPVKVAEAEETANILDAGRGRPLRDPLDLDRVHVDGSITDYHAQVFHLFFVEFAFGWFEE